MGINIDELNDVDVSTSTGSSYEAPDDGDYNLVVAEMEYGNTSNGKGTGFKVKFTILDGDYAGQDVYTYFNVTNPNETAQRIGREQLKTVMTLTGVSNTDDVVGKSIRARLIGEVGSYNGKATVNVRPVLYMSLDGKNAKGEPIVEFVKKGESAKEKVLKMNANSTAVNNTDTTIPNSQASGQASTTLDDDIPF